MTDTPSFQDMLDDFADEVFVGRSEQLSLFEEALEADKPKFLILNISGQGGVGKSTLIDRYRGIAKDKGIAFSVVNQDHSAVPQILEAFALQLEQEGLSFKNFNERYRKYLELSEKIESDPKMPSGLMDYAVRGIAKVGVRSLRRIPVAGEIAEVFLTDEAEGVLAEQASEWSKYIAQKFTNKDEKNLLLETNDELTKSFLVDLAKGLEKQKVVLCFDTFEKTSGVIDKWLFDLVSGRYSNFSSRVMLVIAGRYPLGQIWTKYRKAIRLVELKEFTDEEARDYLNRSGITDEVLVSQLIESSERLPVVLAMLVSAPGQLPGNVTGDAVERFLEGLTVEQREAALISSLPRYFNQDILNILLGIDEAKNAFEWLSKAAFVRTSENGWVYHDIVRMMMLKYFRMRSFEIFVEKHKRLDEYYKRRVVNLASDSGVQRMTIALSKHEKEKNYHFLCQNPSKNFEILIKEFCGFFWSLQAEFVENPSAEKSTAEAIALIKSVFSGSLAQFGDEFSDLLTKEQLENLRSFVNLLSGNAQKLDSKLYEWLFDFDNLTEYEKGALIILRVDSVEESDKDKYSELILTNLNKLVSMNPLSVVSYYNRGSHYLNSKERKLAVADFSKLIELQPDNSYCYFLRGLAAWEDDNSTALEDFTRAVISQPENVDYLAWRGLTYFIAKEYLPALDDYNKVIALEPDKADNYLMRGRIYKELKSIKDAIVDFTKAIEIKPENDYYYEMRGRTYHDGGEYQKAIEDFSKVIELQPVSGEGYFLRGQAHAASDTSAALNDFAKAIELQPEQSIYYKERGRIYMSAKEFQAALADYNQAIRLDPGDMDLHVYRGITHFVAKEYENALDDCNKYIQVFPDSSVGYAIRGMVQDALADYDLALIDYSKAIELHANYDGLYYKRGLIYLARKENTLALADFNKAVELNLEKGEYYFMRGFLYFLIGEPEKGQADIFRTFAIMPRSEIRLLIEEFKKVNLSEENLEMVEKILAIL